MTFDFAEVWWAIQVIRRAYGVETYDEVVAHEQAAPIRAELAAVERRRIIDTLKDCGYNQTRAAKILGISRGTMATRLRDYNIRTPRRAP